MKATSRRCEPVEGDRCSAAARIRRGGSVHTSVLDGDYRRLPMDRSDGGCRFTMSSCVAALLLATSCYADTGSTESTSAAADQGAAAAAGATGDGSRFGNARPRPARATPADDTSPAPRPAPHPRAGAPALGAHPGARAAPRAAAPRLRARRPRQHQRAALHRRPASRRPRPAPRKSGRSVGGWNMPQHAVPHPDDEGPERYFKYQTNQRAVPQGEAPAGRTVVGTYAGWTPTRYLRLRTTWRTTRATACSRQDGVRGKDESVGNAVSKAKYVPSQGGSAYVRRTSTAPATTPALHHPALLALQQPPAVPSLATPPSNSLAGSAGAGSNYNYNYKQRPVLPYDGRRYDNGNFGQRIQQAQPQAPSRSTTAFRHAQRLRYYLPRHTTRRRRCRASKRPAASATSTPSASGASLLQRFARRRLRAQEKQPLRGLQRHALRPALLWQRQHPPPPPPPPRPAASVAKLSGCDVVAHVPVAFSLVGKLNASPSLGPITAMPYASSNFQTGA
ncbi:Uncharacterized protein GBIM_01316 [Gryllus bimaculatus]|nr:Uncharacterized protein GBIM_01316 [Gryllus bimaculatus]